MELYHRSYNHLLDHLHEMKAAYQPNMLKALSIVGLMALSLSIYLLLFIPNPISTLNQPVFGTPESKLGGNQSAMGKMISGLEALRGLIEYNHDGFAGFHGYTIRPENHYLSPDVEIEVGRSDGTERLGNEVAVVDELPEPWERGGYADGDGVGGLGDCGLPKGESLIRLANYLYPPVNTNITLPKGPTEPAFLKLTEHIRFPEFAMKDTGLVVLTFVITSEGNIEDRTLITEDPPGFGLAQAVYNVLNEAICFPAKVDGQKVDRQVTLFWTLCWTCQEEVISTENLTVSK